MTGSTFVHTLTHKKSIPCCFHEIYIFHVPWIAYTSSLRRNSSTHLTCLYIFPDWLLFRQPFKMWNIYAMHYLEISDFFAMMFVTCLWCSFVLNFQAKFRFLCLVFEPNGFALILIAIITLKDIRNKIVSCSY